MQLCFAPVPEAFGALGPKDLLHPLLTTFGNFTIFGPSPRTFPEGPETHLDAARQKLPRYNLCRSIAAQLPSPRGQFWKRKKCPLLWGRGNLGGILRDNVGEGNLRVKNCRETVGSQFLPRGIKMPRRALWVWVAMIVSQYPAIPGPLVANSEPVIWPKATPWESAKVSHEKVFALLRLKRLQLEMARMRPKN